MTIEQLLLKSPQQLEEYCRTISDKDKQDLYEQLMDEAQGKNLKELKELDELLPEMCKAKRSKGFCRKRTKVQ